MIQIHRDQVDDLLYKLLPDTFVIVTGLDRSGKSTFVANHFRDAPTLKCNEEMGPFYFENERIRQVYRSYCLFDRHPAIDYPVYQTAYHDLTDSQFDELVNRHKDLIKDHQIIYFPKDIYNPHVEYEGIDNYQNTRRDRILYLFNRSMELLSDLTIYKVVD